MKKSFIILKKYKHLLTKQQFKTFKGQILSGDTLGFRKGLYKLIVKEKQK